MIKVIGLMVLAMCELVGMPLASHAQSYPARSITVVVPFPAGGPSDVVARIVTEHMGRTLGQSMVIENIGGAGGTIGSARVAAANPDGYTLLAGSMGSHVAAPVLTPNVKYDSEADRLHSACAGRDRRQQGFPSRGSAWTCGLSEKARQRCETGAWRHLLFASAAGVRPTLVAYRGTGP